MDYRCLINDQRVYLSEHSPYRLQKFPSIEVLFMSVFLVLVIGNRISCIIKYHSVNSSGTPVIDRSLYYLTKYALPNVSIYTPNILAIQSFLYKNNKLL